MNFSAANVASLYYALEVVLASYCHTLPGNSPACINVDSSNPHIYLFNNLHQLSRAKLGFSGIIVFYIHSYQ